MTTMMEFFKEQMQKGVQEFDEKDKNHSLEKETIIEIHNIDNGNWFDISTNAVSGKIISAFLFSMLEHLPELKENNNTMTTEIYLNGHEIEKIIKNFHNSFKIESDEFIVVVVNKLKEIA